MPQSFQKASNTIHTPPQQPKTLLSTKKLQILRNTLPTRLRTLLMQGFGCPVPSTLEQLGRGPRRGRTGFAVPLGRQPVAHGRCYSIQKEEDPAENTYEWSELEATAGLILGWGAGGVDAHDHYKRRIGKADDA